MSIGNVNGAGMNPYPYTNSRRKAAGKGSFSADMQKTAKERDTEEKSRLSPWKGDMVVSQPPSYFGFIYDHSLSSKSKEEMTMDEYKQWFMNEMSGMPVSGWYRSTCVGGALTITEECFERMKSDPEWEKTVLGMVRKMYSCTGIMGSRMIGYQVIGATPEQCHGEGIPVKDGSPLSSGNEKSWWEKRHERMEELIEKIAEEEIERKAAKKVQEDRAAVQENYLKSQMASRQRLQAFLARSVQNGDDAAAFQSEGVITRAVNTYEENINIFSESICPWVHT
uniref:DUF6033 family protein n=1 Tax=Enterocloster clostridioformis TaxID=1531 RepID=UPI001C3E1847|nr:DUF6033 family protein [Enterocloster clostridioformis]